MAESFESRLNNAAGEDNVKKGKQLLKGDNPICAWRNAKGQISAVFREKKDRVEYVEVNGLDSSCVCSCDLAADHLLCLHAVAAIMYFAKFNQPQNQEQTGEEPAQYRGLKYEGFSELTEQVLNPPQAELILYAESAFPHVPSKFEHALLRAKIKVGSKEYIGNLSNLRQLHFGKVLATSVKISFFSQQDRQIIRFLSINSEADASRLTLDSEQTAEFFHCLGGFDNFYRDGNKVVIHRSMGEPVMLYENTPAGCLLRSALMIDGAIMPLKGAKVITGRAGCWAGIDGEYWWVPATVDVAWLRSFLRTSEQDCDVNATRMLMDEKEHLPVRLIRSDRGELERKKVSILYNGILSAQGTLEMQVSFDYDGVYYPPDQSGFGRSDGFFWRRDVEQETAIIDELVRFGFKTVKPTPGRPVFRLEDPEAIGFFADRMMPEWQRQRRSYYLSGPLAAICSGGRGVPEIDFTSRVIGSDPKNYVIEYILQCDKARFQWKDIYLAAKANHHYYLYAGRVCKISEVLRRFLVATANIVFPVNGEKYHLQIPRSAVPFWTAAATGLPGAVPPEFHAVCEMLAHPDAMLFSEPEPETPKAFKINADLREYQKDGVRWLKSMTGRGFNVILADEMGLGKTLQALTLLADTLGHDSPPALVVCPTSLVENWVREAEKFVPEFKVTAVTGNKRGDIWQESSDSNLIVTSYAIIKRDYHFLEKRSFTYLILDEAQHIKNPSTANARTCKAIAAKQRLVLTGTPLENSPDDLWSIFDFLHPDMLGSYHSFRNYYSDIDKDHDKQLNLAARVSPFILRRKKAQVCTELPPKQEQVLFCEMEASQRKLYDTIMNAGRVQLSHLAQQKKPTANLEILTILMRLRQICCHPDLLPSELNSDTHDSAKMDLLKELILENIDSGHKMLLFSQFTSLLQLIKPWLEEEAIKYEYLDGSTKDRQARVDHFNSSPEIPLFLLSLKAGGTGLNLTSADTVIIFDPWWNPAVESQATDRTHRIGQLRSVTGVKLVVKDTIEEKILALQQRKAELFQNLVENNEAAAEKLSIEDLEFLLL